MSARLITLQACLLTALCYVAFWNGLGHLDITDLDEGLYAAAARDMALTGDWITPRVNGAPFFEKPPLLYWLSSSSIRWLGPTEAAVRTPTALAASVLVFMTWLVGIRYLDRRAGFLSAAFLALSPISAGSGRLVTTDMLLTLALSAGILLLFAARNARGSRAILASAAVGFLCGLAVLAKGAPGIMIPAGVVGIWTLLRRRRGIGAPSIVRNPALAGLALMVFLATMLPWHLAAWRANGRSFTEEYVLRQHIGRFKGGDVSHHAPPYFFIPGFIAGFFPWSLFTAAALCSRRGASQMANESGGASEPAENPTVELRSLLRTWFWVVFLVFSASGSKLISYILPLYPPAALLAGDWATAAQASVRGRRILITGGFIAATLLALTLGLFSWPDPLIRIIERYANRPIEAPPLDAAILHTVQILAATAAGGVLSFCVSMSLRRAAIAWTSLLAGMAMFLMIAVHRGIPLIDHETVGSLHRLAAAAGARAGDEASVAFLVGPPRRPSALFYLPDDLLKERRVTERARALIATVPAGRSSPRTRDLWVVAPKRAASILRQAGAVCTVRESDYELWVLRAIPPSKPSSDRRSHREEGTTS